VDTASMRCVSDMKVSELKSHTVNPFLAILLSSLFLRCLSGEL
jgi:hypothetical protein